MLDHPNPKIIKNLVENWILVGFSPFSIKFNNNALPIPSLPPFWSQVVSQHLKKSLHMPIQDASICCPHSGIDFYEIWAPSWDPSCGHVGLLWLIKRLQDPPKRQNKRSWASRRSQDRFFMHFWWIVCWFLLDFGLIFDWFWVVWGGVWGATIC